MNYAKSYTKQSYYIEKPRYSSFYILRCTTTVYARGKKASRVTLRIGSLTPDQERSLEEAREYCEEQARNRPNELVLLNGKVVGECDIEFNFGKYFGCKVADVKNKDPEYLRYLYSKHLAERDFISMKLKYFLALWFGQVAIAPG